jgi:hypothetical protein
MEMSGKWQVECAVCKKLMTRDQHLASCNTCTNEIHVGCGFYLDGNNADCRNCCIAMKRNPPVTYDDGTTVAAGLEWMQLQFEKYVTIMNFVNIMMIDPEVAADFKAEPNPRGELLLTPEAGQVMMALDMQAVGCTGDTNKDCIAGLNSWLPNFFHPSCIGYLTFFHKISTSENDGVDKALNDYYKKFVRKNVIF